jgi:Adenylate and Guanylate cyclase catalytic domain
MAEKVKPPVGPFKLSHAAYQLTPGIDPSASACSISSAPAPQRISFRSGMPSDMEEWDSVMVVFDDPVPVENPALQAVLMALEMREAIGALTETWRRWGHEIGLGIGIAHGFATLGTIGFEGRFDYAAIGTVSNVASRLCDEAKPNPHQPASAGESREGRAGRAGRRI